MDYTISLTEAENKAMEYSATDVYEWIDNAVKNRARIAIDEICDLYVKHKLDNAEPITVTTKDEMVLAAYSEGLIKTSAERNQEILDNLNAQINNPNG